MIMLKEEGTLICSHALVIKEFSFSLKHFFLNMLKYQSTEVPFLERNLSTQFFLLTRLLCCYHKCSDEMGSILIQRFRSFL